MKLKIIIGFAVREQIHFEILVNSYWSVNFVQECTTEVFNVLFFNLKKRTFKNIAADAKLLVMPSTCFQTNPPEFKNVNTLFYLALICRWVCWKHKMFLRFHPSWFIIWFFNSITTWMKVGDWDYITMLLLWYSYLVFINSKDGKLMRNDNGLYLVVSFNVFFSFN